MGKDTLFFLHGDARIVADMLTRPGQAVKQGGLARVGITGQGNGE